jgi:thiol-disulfide isomerase/thioredoxin
MASWILSALMCAAVGGSSDCTIVHFTAAWCKPCQQVVPSLERLQQEGWSVRVVDADRQPQLVQQFRVENLPTIVVLCRNQEVDRLVGAASYEQILQRATRAAARNASSRPNPAAEAAAPAAIEVAAPRQAQPIVRGQSPAVGAFPMLASVNNQLANVRDATSFPSPSVQPVSSVETTTPMISPQAAISRASAATVRIRVDEGNTTAFGTGTIIDIHGQEALVLTCGHLFRDMQPNSQVTVDLFAGTAEEVNLPSQLIDFKADGEDIGLISFHAPVHIEPVPILPRGEPLQVGQPVFSFGCDHGADPTRRDTIVKSINRYVGAANVEIAGAPAVGRSGGGLFDAQGRLIGVCNAADASDDEGLYAAAEVVYAQIERLNLSHLFEDQPAQTAGSTLLVNSRSTVDSPSAAPALSTAQVPTGQPSSGQLASAAASPTSIGNPAGQATAPHWPDQDLSLAGGMAAAEAMGHATLASARQVICIVRDADGQDRVVTIESPPAQLLQLIQQSAGR